MLLPPRPDLPEAVFRKGTGHQPFAIRAERGPGRPVLQLTEVKLVDQPPRLSVPDLNSLTRTLPIPGCQPSAIRAEGGLSQVRALDKKLPAGVLQIKEEDLAALRAVGDGSSIGAESEIGLTCGERSPGRQVEGLRGANQQAARLRVRRDRPAL